MTVTPSKHQSLPEPKRKLPMASLTPALARHPQDGWTYADPYPMSERYVRMFHAIITILCPPPPAPLTEDMITRIERHVRGFMMYMHPLAARGLWLSFILLDWAPRLFFTSTKRLSQLERSQADQIINRFTSSRWMPIRLLVVGIRGSVLSAYFDTDEVHQRLKYKPIPFIRQRVELRHDLLSESALAAQ
ncbi:MAG: hypothetical protein R3B07_23840 [Polyangiaceae bacterium]